MWYKRLVTQGGSLDSDSEQDEPAAGPERRNPPTPTALAAACAAAEKVAAEKAAAEKAAAEKAAAEKAAAEKAAACALVERFDIEPFSDFLAK